MKHGIALEHGMLSDEQLLKLKSFDLPLLQQHVNEGKPLPKRKAEEDPLPVMRFNCEPLRYRHKAILFYCFTHGADIILNQVLKRKGFTYVPATDAKNDLGYWYRLPSTLSSSSVSNPLVFAHGVGGLAFCYSLIDSLLGNSIISDDTPVILLDLPHVSLRMYDHIPQVESQVESIAKTIESVASESCARAGIEGSLKDDRTKATFVGHSYGTFLLSWMVQKRPDMVGSCVFIGKYLPTLKSVSILILFKLLTSWSFFYNRSCLL
jgi:pimeloyl-ACP methyl ester carboxylesterase